MGLCKCPQRKVSTLFCFKHHVNVCESCLVNEHAQCIVRSYVSWLQDNDYSSNCSLCQRSLFDTNQETIRLICYDLFHWSCLNQYCLSFPNHTAPDGYTCPTCHTCIFPSLNLVSPIADQVRRKLSTVNWANRLPNFNQTKQTLLTETENNDYVIVNSTEGLAYHPNRTIDMTQGISRSIQMNLNDDDDNDKYKRRSIFTWFARWLHSQQSVNRKTYRKSSSSTRFNIYLILVIVFVFLSILIILYHFTRRDENDQIDRIQDPQFNPLNNPFIRIGKNP